MALVKDIYSEVFLETIMSAILEYDATFNQALFQQKIEAKGWEELTLMGRVDRFSSALHESLENKDLTVVGPLLLHIQETGKGLAYIFLPDYVAKYGQNNVPVALQLLEQLTSGSTGEFAIRAFLTNHYEETMTKMKIWSQHPTDEHVRRLASEGCRTRLPWAKKVPGLVDQTADIITILKQLKDDESLYVRKSVANNINDLSKDHPQLVIELMGEWHSNASAEVMWLIRKGLRTLLKEGQSDVLALLDYAVASDITLTDVVFNVDRIAVSLGETSTFTYSFDALASEKTTVRLLLEVDFVKKHGTSTKRFFLSEKKITPLMKTYGGEKNYVWKNLTTRQHYTGTHVFRLVLNGEIIGETTVDFSI